MKEISARIFPSNNKTLSLTVCESLEDVWKPILLLVDLCVVEMVLLLLIVLLLLLEVSKPAALVVALQSSEG